MITIKVDIGYNSTDIEIEVEDIITSYYRDDYDLAVRFYEDMNEEERKNFLDYFNLEEVEE